MRVYPGGTLYMRGKYHRLPGASEIKEYTWEQLIRREIVKDATEYIMVGTTMKQINIINVTPGRYGDFEELMARFKNVKVEKK